MTDTFTVRELAQEVQREINQRRWVYSGLIERGKLSQHIAQRRIAMMEVIHERLARDAELEEALTAAKQGRLL